MQTHESYILQVRETVLAFAQADELRGVKMLYGAGRPGLRGQCIYSQWINGRGPDNPEPIIEICALGQSDPVQICGTVIHELGHALAGHEAGHGPKWKKACRELGLRRARKSLPRYMPAMFPSALRESLYAIPLPCDGHPRSFAASGAASGGCTAGLGSRGGQSVGAGSGSRMLKLECDECGCIARMARKWIECAGLPTCGCSGGMRLR